MSHEETEQRMTNEHDEKGRPMTYWGGKEQSPSNVLLADELEAADVETILESDLLDRVCTALRATHEPATEHPPQLMAVVDKWQDNANSWREMTPHTEREDAALVDLILRDIREAVSPASPPSASHYLDGLTIDQWRAHAKAGWAMYAAAKEGATSTPPDADTDDHADSCAIFCGTVALSCNCGLADRRSRPASTKEAGQ